MARKILTLGSGGKLALKSADGKTEEVNPKSTLPPLVYFLLDCSASMEGGGKISQAKSGVMQFAEDAFGKGYWMGLIKFDSDASEVFGPTQDLSLVRKTVARLDTGSTTNMTGAITLGIERAGVSTGTRCFVIFTDGMPDRKGSALDAAERAKSQGIEIIIVGTDDADWDFLSKLATREGLAAIVNSKQLQAGIAASAKLLPGARK